MSLNNNKSINDDRDEDRNISFTSHNKNIKSDDTGNDINTDNDGLNVI